MTLPNVREMFVPDPDHIMFECDLKGADAQVVAWEADDEQLKRAFREGLDVHSQNAKDLFDDRELLLSTSAQIKASIRLNRFRQYAKVGVHATNYGCKEVTLAEHLRISVSQAIAFQNRWFDKHPEVYNWHQRTQSTLERTRTVTNKFGYRRQYFDRISEVLPEALAWVPQSTVAICINKGWVNLKKSGLPVEILLQVHDSIVGQFHVKHMEADPLLPKKIKEVMQVTIPYEDPLQIGLSIKISNDNWGACQEWSETA